MMLAVALWGDSKILSKCFSLRLGLGFRNAAELLPVLLGAMGAVLCMGLILRWMRRSMPVWIVLLSVSVIGSVFYGTVMLRYQAQENAKSLFGTTVKDVLLLDTKKEGPRPVLYKTESAPLYGELFYSGAKVIQLPSADQLPDSEARVVYLISSGFPQNPKWSWTNLLPENYTYQKQRVMLWRGNRNFQEKFKEK